MTIADKLRETDEYKKFVANRESEIKKSLDHIVDVFTKDPTKSLVYYFGKSGRNCTDGFGGESMDKVRSILRENGFKVDERCNGYGVYYLYITL